VTWCQASSIVRLVIARDWQPPRSQTENDSRRHRRQQVTRLTSERALDDHPASDRSPGFVIHSEFIVSSELVV
jgi:hypothetical protein